MSDASVPGAGSRSPSPVNLSAGLPETVLPAEPAEAQKLLGQALSADGDDERRTAFGRAAAEYPSLSSPWAKLSQVARDDIEGYAYARVGYHRGLDALRKAGWKGSGYVRWREPSNRGFLRALDCLRERAEAIGENGEAERCATFLKQLDPDWPPDPSDPS